MKITKTSQNGLNLIIDAEGFEPKAYLDIAGIPTIGFGTIRYPDGRKVSLSDPEITRTQAIGYLMHDVTKFESALDAMCRDDINQNQFDALVSFSYNLGSDSLKKSTLLVKVNANPADPSIRAEFLKWVYANGKKSKGLLARRTKETDLYFS